MSLRAGSGGVSVRAGASPSLRGGRSALRGAMRRATVQLSRGTGSREMRHAGAALLCGMCGMLTWPGDERGQDPHRVDATSLVHQEACEHCGNTSWLDMRYESTALALRLEAERSDPRWTDTITRSVIAGAVGASVGFVLSGVLYLGLWPVVAMGLWSAVLAGAYAEWQRRLTVLDVPGLPERWMMALPPAGDLHPVGRGPIGPKAEALRAPISGRSCVAYELGLREDADAGGDPESWALLEQRIAPSAVGERSLPADGAHLRLRREHRGPLVWAELDEAARVHLRRLGFDANDEGLHLFETVLEPGTPVELARGDGGLLLRPQPGSSTNG